MVFWILANLSRRSVGIRSGISTGPRNLESVEQEISISRPVTGLGSDDMHFQKNHIERKNSSSHNKWRYIIAHLLGPRNLMELLTNKRHCQSTVCQFFDAARPSSQNQRRRDLPVLKSSNHLRPQAISNSTFCACLRLCVFARVSGSGMTW